MKGGIVILNKGEGMSSQSAVNRLKRLLGVKKAGHTGTLDPLATGVLPILVERGVKASEYVTSEDKHYRAILTLGVTTDTEDITGTPLTHTAEIPDKNKVMAAVKQMIGTSLQTPPMYSAIKIDGKKLYDLAREGKTVEREPREITVYSIDCERLSDTDYSLDVHCSKGTYIRTLCADIGAALGCGGIMRALERTECAGYTLRNSHTLDEIEGMSDEEKAKIILPIEEIFKKYKKITLPPFFSRLARCGVEIYLKKIAASAEAGERFSLYDGEDFFALGEVREFEGGLAIKPIKQFDV